MALVITYDTCELCTVMVNNVEANAACIISDSNSSKAERTNASIKFSDLTVEEQAIWTNFLDLVHHKAEAIIGIN